jgi:transposase-like protein
VVRFSDLQHVVLKIAEVKHWLCRAVDQTGVVLDVLVPRRRDKQAAKRLLRKAYAHAQDHDPRLREDRAGTQTDHCAPALCHHW